jgi:GT2 family glycosyltransferase
VIKQTNPTLAAVIVTYNRGEKLEAVLDALEAQTRLPDQIYVIDNASTDDTAARMANRVSDRIFHMRLPKNIGGAGGFNAGLKAAYGDGMDLIWISDDDAYPAPDAIENLATSLVDFEEKTGAWAPFACSAVYWTDGSWCEMNTPNAVWDWPRHFSDELPYLLVGSCSFVSVLVPRWAVKEHGFPISDYFIWYDDAEYTQRLSRSHPGLFVPASKVKHDLAVNVGVNYSMITEKTLWKYCYGARNETSFRRGQYGIVGILSFAYSVRKQMRTGRVPISLRWRIYSAIGRGVLFRPKIEKPVASASFSK